MLAILAQDPDSEITDYGDADIVRKNESAVDLEFLDVYRSGKKKRDIIRKSDKLLSQGTERSNLP